jgi:hypothetical protein
MEGLPRSLILDPGSHVSILQPAVSGRDVRITGMKPHGVTGEAIDIKGLQSVNFSLNGREYTHAFLVCSLPTEEAGLLGTDFLEKTGALVEFEHAKISITEMGAAPRVCGVSPSRHIALPVFTEGKAGRIPQLKQQETQRAAAPPLNRLSPENVAQRKAWLAKAKENVVIAPRCRQIVLGKIESDREESIPPLVCVESAQVPIEGILPARAL